MSQGSDDSDSVFRQFLNKTDESTPNYPIVDPSNPVNWRKAIIAFVGAIATYIIIAAQTIINTAISLPSRILSALETAIYTPEDVLRYPGGKETIEASGIIPTIQREVLDLIEAAWSPLTGLGWLALPAAVAEILIAFFVIRWVISYIREEVF
jgi:hypothetical protein